MVLVSLCSQNHGIGSNGQFLLKYCSLNKSAGTLAQLVEQRTENPCVPGSIPGGTTNKIKPLYFL